MQNKLISPSTLKNWNKLNSNSEEKLIKRANKRNSNKHIIPIEYIKNKETIPFIENLIPKINEENLFSSIFSLGLNLLNKYNLSEKSHVKETLKYLNNIKIIDEFLKIDLPEETDILGIIYQSSMTEGKKNQLGSYYTFPKITEILTKDINLTNKTFLDPCCGSGAFLLSIKTDNPNNLFGIDFDEIAVLIAKINLLIKYEKFSFIPKIYFKDFLRESFNKTFDFIVTNPPWGSFLEDSKTKEDSFSLFFKKSYSLLKEEGIIKFLLPESVLNVKTHKNLRKFILEETNLFNINVFKDKFSGVITDFVSIECQNSSRKNDFLLNEKEKINKNSIYQTKNLNFNFLNERDLDIIEKIKNKGKFSLKDSIFGLGIVTGNNKSNIFKNKEEGMEAIYTGKDIKPFVLSSPQNFIFYDREKLQQVAKEEIYRNNEKLIYKFISKKLIFAYDEKGSLCLNSANILIPTSIPYKIKTTLAFLNSSLFNFYYQKLFHEIKILKGNLMELPFPEISSGENLKISSLVDKILKGEDLKEEINSFIFSLYNFSDEDKNYIKGEIQ